MAEGESELRTSVVADQIKGFGVRRLDSDTEDNHQLDSFAFLRLLGRTIFHSKLLDTSIKYQI